MALVQQHTWLKQLHRNYIRPPNLLENSKPPDQTIKQSSQPIKQSSQPIKQVTQIFIDNLFKDINIYIEGGRRKHEQSNNTIL
jgi:hypothetical protein